MKLNGADTQDKLEQPATIPAPFSPAEQEMTRELGGRKWGSSPRIPKAPKVPHESINARAWEMLRAESLELAAEGARVPR